MKTRVYVLAAGLLSVWGLSLAGARQAHGVGAPSPAQADTTRSVWEGVYTEAQARRGEALYLQRCALCHSADLTGGESAPPLAGPVFTANWNGLTLGDLVERIRISMPPEQPGVLSRQQYADVTAHVLKGNLFPTGEHELAREIEILKQIRFESTKPEP